MMTQPTIKVWLDDEPQVAWRQEACPPDQWVHTRWPDETIALLKQGNVTHLSLDHDLGDKDASLAEERRERTGYDVIVWIEEQVKNYGFVPPPFIRAHSQNGPGRDRIVAGIKQIEKYHQMNIQG